MKSLVVLSLPLLLLLTLVRTVLAAPSASTLPAQPTRLPVSGTIQSIERYNNVSPDMVVTATGYGDVSSFGQFALTYKIEWNLLDLSTAGDAYFVMPSGDSLQAKVMGQAVETQPQGMYSVTEIYTITGGTGQFEDASGTLTLLRQVNRTTGITTSTFQGTLLMKQLK